MPFNATTSEEAASSYRRSSKIQTQIVFYQEGFNTEKNYASIPASTKYKEVLDSACECFEEFLPPNWETYVLDLQHEISEGRWAVIHPSLFEEAAEGARPQFEEIKLRVRPPRNQRPTRIQINTGAVSPTASISSASASSAVGPPSYDTAVALATTVQASGPLRLTLILENPEPPISAPRHDAWCDRCSQMIVGIRYKCATCEDFDYCSVCIAFAALEHGHRFDAIINGNTRLLRSIDAWRVTGREQTTGAASGADGTLAFKHEARCDICGMNPIKGTRFKCAECPDWDVCQGCLERSFMVHPEHTFIRVTDPTILMPRNTKVVVRAPVGIRCSSCQNQVLGPVFYQCKTTGCRVNLCADCEGLPITQARPCQHALMKYRWPWATQG